MCARHEVSWRVCEEEEEERKEKKKKRKNLSKSQLRQVKAKNAIQAGKVESVGAFFPSSRTDVSRSSPSTLVNW